MKKLCPREDALPLEVPIRVGSSNTRLPTNIVSFDTTSDSTSDKPDNCLDLIFGISIRTVPKLVGNLKNNKT